MPKQQQIARELERLEMLIQGLKKTCGVEEETNEFMRPRRADPFDLNQSAALQKNTTYRPWMGRAFTSRLLAFTIAWQVLNVGLLTVIDAYTEDSVFATSNPYYVLGLFTMVACQLVHLGIIIAATIKLAKQLLHHTATAGFLVQSYLSTVILYAGLYTLLHRYQGEVWIGKGGPTDTFPVQGSLSSDTYITKTFVVFFYFSVQTISSVGFGDLTPRVWYLYLLVSTEMLLGVFYMVAILGRSLDTMLKKPLDRDATLMFKGPSLYDKVRKFVGRDKKPTSLNLHLDENRPLLMGSA